MTPVFPYQVRRSEDGWGGELLLRLKKGKSAYVVQLSLEQARMLAVEMSGLATSHCPQHHLALLLAKSLGGHISHVILKLLDPTGGVLGILRVVTGGQMHDVNVDAAAALAMAIHLGLPIFMDGDSGPGDGRLRAIQGLTEGPSLAAIPQAFRDAFDDTDLQLPDADSGT